MNRRSNILAQIDEERDRQDFKWGGASHDDRHSTADFIRWIKNYASWSDMMAEMLSWNKARWRLIQVAALAVAAIESIDRKREQKLLQESDWQDRKTPAGTREGE